MAYWTTVGKRAWEATQYRQPWKVYSSVGSALATPIGNYLAGRLTVLSTVFSSILVGLSVYALLTMAEFVYRFFSVPAQMYGEAMTEITEGTDQIRQLKAQLTPPPPIAIEIVGIFFSGPANININFKISNNGSIAATLQRWALSSLSEPLIVPQMISPLSREKLVKVGAGEVQLESIGFQIHGRALADIKKRGMAWRLKFSDTSKRPYEVVLPENLYPVS